MQLTFLSEVRKFLEDFSISLKDWNDSDFSPSSSIIDAALSLYGNHDVSAIKAHENEMKTINPMGLSMKKFCDWVWNWNSKSYMPENFEVEYKSVCCYCIIFNIVHFNLMVPCTAHFVLSMWKYAINF